MSSSRGFLMSLLVLSGWHLAGSSVRGQSAAPVELPILIVESQVEGPLMRAADADALDRATAGNAAELLETLPGVSMVRRSACAAEPVIRGMGWERVTTQVDGLPLHGACPSRMDPPLLYLAPREAEAVTVAKGLPSVTLGPGGTGGHVLIRTVPEDGAEGGDFRRHQANLLWNGARDGWQADWKSEAHLAPLDLRLTLDAMDLGDYQSADGVTVPAGHTSAGGGLGLGLSLGARQRLTLGYTHKQEEDIDYPSLPMNTDESEFNRLSGAWTLTPAAGLERLQLSLGYATVDHLMSNRGKPNRGMMEMETPSRADSWSGKLTARQRGADDSTWDYGIDASRVEREATRTRRMRAGGMAAREPVWPDAVVDQAGLFLENSRELGQTLTLRAGTRVDASEGEARDAGAVIPLGAGAPRRTVADWYGEYGGPGARDAESSHTLAGGNLLLEWSADAAWTLYGGIGRTARAPSVTEQFFAFAPATGGYQVGNPDLDPEARHSLEVGARSERETLSFSVDAFASRVEDYILPTRIDQRDVDADGKTDLVRGYRNVDAELLGGEIALTWRPVDGLSLPVQLAVVRARNRTEDRDLPEIPPLHGRAALRYDDGTWWVEPGVAFAARQDRVDASFPEDETPGWASVQLKAGLRLRDRLDLEAGVENLLDREYHDHLTREAATDTGDLRAGDEIPVPGRFAYVSLRLIL